MWPVAELLHPENLIFVAKEEYVLCLRALCCVTIALVLASLKQTSAAYRCTLRKQCSGSTTYGWKLIIMKTIFVSKKVFPMKFLLWLTCASGKDAKIMANFRDKSHEIVGVAFYFFAKDVER